MRSPTTTHSKQRKAGGERSLVIFTTLKLTLNFISVLSVKLEYCVKFPLLRMKAVFSFNDKVPGPCLHMLTVKSCVCRSLSWKAVWLDESHEPRCQRRWVFMHQPPGNYLAICGLTGVGDFIQIQQLDLICQQVNKNSVC